MRINLLRIRAVNFKLNSISLCTSLNVSMKSAKVYGLECIGGLLEEISKLHMSRDWQTQKAKAYTTREELAPGDEGVSGVPCTQRKYRYLRAREKGERAARFRREGDERAPLNQSEACAARVRTMCAWGFAPKYANGGGDCRAGRRDARPVDARPVDARDG